MNIRVATISFFLFVSALVPCLSYSQSPEAKPVDLSSVRITMKRDSCYGPCPVYSVSIDGNGAVIYEGVEYVKVKGKKVYRIPKEKVAELVNGFYKINYFALEDKYTEVKLPNGISQVTTDLPSTTTSITVNGKTKSVYNYDGAPQILIELEYKIDKISKTARFMRRRK